MKKNVNVLMDLELKKALDKDAKKNHRSVGKHINFIIDSYLTGVYINKLNKKGVAK